MASLTNLTYLHLNYNQIEDLTPIAALVGIDDLEQARTYGAPQFVEQFGSFQTLSRRYGGAPLLKSDLEAVKQHLYVPMTIN